MNDQGIRQVILTSNKKHNVEPFMKLLIPDVHFEVFAEEQMIEHDFQLKVNAIKYINVLYNLKPDEVVFIDDNELNLEQAKDYCIPMMS
mmetsp:Transcript_39733/g.33536  ORF Transcript_39733/g.33536 Transcript_39733/m.33536 type:complete len:89 (+) Transcript_39733:132-398(+)